MKTTIKEITGAAAESLGEIELTEAQHKELVAKIAETFRALIDSVVSRG